MSEDVVNDTVQNEPGNTAPTEPNYEELASRQGWVPKDKWHGNPDTWKEAKAFYEDGEKFAPYIRANNRKLEARLEDVTRHLAEVTGYMNQQNAVLRKQMEQEREQAKHLILQLQTQKAEAIQNGDGIKVVDLENKIDVLKAKELEASVQTAQSQPQVDPRTVAAFQSWHVDNQWYGKDRRASAVADAAAEEFRTLNPTAQPSDVFAYAEAEVKKIFTQYSEQPRQGIPAPEGGSANRGTPRPGTKAKHSYNDLPDADKRVCDMVVADAQMARSRLKGDALKRLPEYTRETFVKEYFGD